MTGAIWFHCQLTEAGQRTAGKACHWPGLLRRTGIVRYARTMRYPGGGGLTAAERARREQVRFAALNRSLANLTKQGIDQLVAQIKSRLKPMQYRCGLIDGFLAKTGLDPTLP